MRRIIYCFIFILTHSLVVFSQTGTIKISKPKVENLGSVVVKPKYFITPIAGINYTFKKNNKVGYDLGVLFSFVPFRPYHRSYFIGFEYSMENQYYKSFDLTIDNVQTEYLSMPFGIVNNLVFGARGDVGLVLGITPEYQFKLKSDKFKASQFNSFNVSANISLVFPIGNRLGIRVSYSKDIFRNLKDLNIFNLNGDEISMQQSRTNLMTFAFICSISR